MNFFSACLISVWDKFSEEHRGGMGKSIVKGMIANYECGAHLRWMIECMVDNDVAAYEL